MKKIHIAVVDNGIAIEFLKKPLKYNIYIDHEGKCLEEALNIGRKDFMHGTICAMLIEGNFNQCILSSVRYLDENGKGSINYLYPALEWCFYHEVHLVNLSLGSVHFNDKKAIRTIVNHFMNKGLCIIAATSNSGYLSYPASFAGIIGVATDQGGKIDYQSNVHLGLDLVAPVANDIIRDEQIIALQKSNSYAAPYITALIGKLCLQKNLHGIASIRQALCVHNENCVCISTICSEPDWISKAWIKTDTTKSKIQPYFDVVNGSLQEALDKIDTIVVNDSVELEDIISKNKHIVYLGKKEVKHFKTDKLFWSRDNRLNQIKSCTKTNDRLDIPMILCVLPDNFDEIRLLTELREYFYEDGYNIYAISLLEESVLYDLEFIPAEVLSESEGCFNNFLYGQTFFKQSDSVLIGINKKLNSKVSLQSEADLQIIFGAEQQGYMVKLFSDKILVWKKLYKAIEGKWIKDIYSISILNHFLMGEDNEQSGCYW